jgi:hypothetical protein
VSATERVHSTIIALKKRASAFVVRVTRVYDAINALTAITEIECAACVIAMSERWLKFAISRMVPVCVGPTMLARDAMSARLDFTTFHIVCVRYSDLIFSFCTPFI